MMAGAGIAPDGAFQYEVLPQETRIIASCAALAPRGADAYEHLRALRPPAFRRWGRFRRSCERWCDDGHQPD